jgi:hypothetical protein
MTFITEKISDVEEDVEGLMTGRYRMTSSEGFDEFMKALGVGLMKRKLANSVTPVVVIEISEDGGTHYSNSILLYQKREL